MATEIILEEKLNEKEKWEDNYIKFTIPEVPESKKNNYAVKYDKKKKKAILYKWDKWVKYEKKFKYWLRKFIKDKYFIKNKDVYPVKHIKGIVMIFYFKDKHRKDLFNLAQFIDLFVDLKILEDDNWDNTGDVLLKSNFKRWQEEKTEVYFFL